MTSSTIWVGVSSARAIQSRLSRLAFVKPHATLLFVPTITPGNPGSDTPVTDTLATDEFMPDTARLSYPSLTGARGVSL